MTFTKKTAELFNQLSDLAIKHKAFSRIDIYTKNNEVAVVFKSSDLQFAQKKKGEDPEYVLQQMVNMVKTKELEK